MLEHAHLPRLITVVLALGYKVGRVDQSETALGAEMRVAADKSRGKVGNDKQKEKIVRRCVICSWKRFPSDGARRELNKVYTNGTLVDDELLTDDQAGHCLSIREDEAGGEYGSFGICVLDSATSEFNLSAFDDDVCRTKLETLIRQLRPKEIVFTKVWQATVATTHRFPSPISFSTNTGKFVRGHDALTKGYTSGGLPLDQSS